MSKNFMDYDNATSLFTKLKTALGKKSTVTWQQLQVTGDKIAEITVSGVKQDIFSHSIVVSRMQMSGTHIADITIDGVKNEIFAPNGGGGGYLNDLEDVTISSLSDKNGLVYNSTTSKWENNAAVLIGSNVKYISVVTALPSDAAQHIDTLYLIKET